MLHHNHVLTGEINVKFLLNNKSCSDELKVNEQDRFQTQNLFQK